MADSIWEDKEFRIIRCKRDYVLIRKNFAYKYHAHFEDLKGAKTVVVLFYKKLIPHGRYQRGSMKRLTTDEEYENFVEQRKKPKYRNQR